MALIAGWAEGDSRGVSWVMGALLGAAIGQLLKRAKWYQKWIMRK